MRRVSLFGILSMLALGCGDSSGFRADAEVMDATEEEMDSSLDEDAGAPEPAQSDAQGMDAEAADPSMLNDAATGADAQVPLPEGSREISGIVNLVDTKAAEQLEQFITSPAQLHPTQRHGLTEAANLFLRLYPEDYDFLYFFTDHPVPTSTNAAVFETVNGEAKRGGGYEFEVRAQGYQSSGKLLGVIGVQHRPNIYPPLAHETAHFWANHLDPRFGFGSDNGMGVGAHWGYSSVRGQLGGFDGEQLRCATPNGARPPACTAEASGRIRYLVNSFFPNDNTAAPYAPLELYLMGLAPAANVPTTFQLLEKASEVDGGRDPDAGTVMLEATGIKTLPFSEILARHGEEPLRPESDRHFRAAFVVVTKTPASEEVLLQVSRWAAVFGNRTKVQGLSAFETLTGGLATMDTTLGARRSEGSVPPAPRPALTCDVLTQDCPRAALACYLGSAPLCALSGGVALDQPCDALYACQAGLDCVSGKTQPNNYVCRPYCDPTDSASAKACTKLCPSNFLALKNGDRQLGALCLPP